MAPDLAPVEGGITVVYVDEAILVLNKPAGLLSVPGRGSDKQDCLSTRAAKLFDDAMIVHRLDMATSGLLVMARGVAVQRTLSAAFATRKVHKRYVAMVSGEVEDAHGTWRTIDLPIAVDWPHRPRRVIAVTGGQPSLTRLRTQHFDPNRRVTRVELEPLTGRTHQLRVHLLATGHPILGDALYAPTVVQEMASRLLLHASELGFSHPVRGNPLHFTCMADF